MIGHFRDGPGTQRYPMAAMKALYPDQANFIALVGAYREFGDMRRVKGLFKGASDLPVTAINAPDGHDELAQRRRWNHAHSFAAWALPATGCAMPATCHAGDGRDRPRGVTADT
jgi:hypothetical protein